jgi:hypothetical protein
MRRRLSMPPSGRAGFARASVCAADLKRLDPAKSQRTQ